MSERRIRIAVIAVDLFEAASAFLGAVGLVVGFMGIPISILIGTPFTDFTVPALLLQRESHVASLRRQHQPA